jgi:hypothetical protein
MFIGSISAGQPIKMRPRTLAKGPGGNEIPASFGLRAFSPQNNGTLP